MPSGMPAKMMLGRSKRAAVMLSNSAPAMGIAEGIETGLSAQKLFGVPVWACSSAQGVAGFPAIHGLKHLTIFADHDDAGIVAARKCAARLVTAGIKGGVKYPSTLGDDWNCYLQKGTNNVD
jgi:putative DNA primase/helicase